MTAEEVIDEARGFHKTFSMAEHTNKVCLQELRRAEKRLFRTLADQVSLGATVTFDVDEIAAALTGAPLGEGESDGFPAFSQLLGAQAQSDFGALPVDLVGDESDLSTARLRVVVRGQQLYLTQPVDVLAELPQSVIDQVAASWDGVLALRITYVPEPAEATLQSELVTPEFGRSFLVGSLVAFMATRDPARLGQSYDAIAEQAKALQAEAIDNAMTIGGRQTKWSVRDVLQR